MKRLLIGLTAIVFVVAALLPAVVPPAIERIVRSKIADFGLKAYVKASLDWGWRNGPGLAGTIRIALADSPWCIRATFGASCCEWAASVKMDETEFSETDPTVARLLKQLPLPAVSNLTFSGSIGLSAHAERTFRKPVAVWSVRVPVRNVTAGATIGEKAYGLSGLSVTPAASGIADHLDIAPAFLRIGAINIAGFAFTNFTASIRASEKSLLVTEASAAVCGGKISPASH